MMEMGWIFCLTHSSFSRRASSKPSAILMAGTSSLLHDQGLRTALLLWASRELGAVEDVDCSAGSSILVSGVVDGAKTALGRGRGQLGSFGETNLLKAF